MKIAQSVLFRGPGVNEGVDLIAASDQRLPTRDPIRLRLERDPAESYLTIGKMKMRDLAGDSQAQVSMVTAE